MYPEIMDQKLILVDLVDTLVVSDLDHNIKIIIDYKLSSIIDSQKVSNRICRRN